jgi:hypothetical protein
MGTLLKRQCVTLFFLVLLNINIYHGMTLSLEPPRGNSLKMKRRTYELKYVYKCNNKTWVPVSASAMLVNISDSKISLGSYSLEYSLAKTKLVGTWNISNDDVDTSESGSPISIVAINEIASKSVQILQALNNFWQRPTSIKTLGLHIRCPTFNV